MTTRLDPSRTGLLRIRFGAALMGRFKVFRSKLWQLVAVEDAFALTRNTRWEYLSPEQRIDNFKQWMHNELSAAQLKNSKGWLDDYIKQAYAKGAGRSFDEVRKPQLAKKADFYKGSKAEFLQSSFGRVASPERVKLLASKTYTELDGVTEAMSQAINRELVNGMIAGLSPREVAKNITNKVDTIGITRALAIAQSETTMAHAEGQLDALEALGVERVGVKVEFVNSGLGTTRKGNLSPCPRCRALLGIVVSIQEAHGMIPVHPYCMCAWTAAGVGEKTEGQIRTRRRIQQAIRKSRGK